MAAPEQQRRAVARLALVRQRLADLLAHELRRYFRGQAARVVARYLVGDVELVPDDEVSLLLTLMSRRLWAVALEADRAASDLLGLPQDDYTFRLRMLFADTGYRVRGLTEETRRAVRKIIAEGMARGYHPRTIARGRPKEGFRGLREVVQETYRRRAETIARTETGRIWNLSTAERFQAANVTRVRIFDGAGCGWGSHNDSDKANGSIRDVTDFRARPLAHPNCRRGAAPVVERRAG
jgi:hypothetical protein